MGSCRSMGAYYRRSEHLGIEYCIDCNFVKSLPVRRGNILVYSYFATLCTLTIKLQCHLLLVFTLDSTLLTSGVPNMEGIDHVAVIESNDGHFSVICKDRSLARRRKTYRQGPLLHTIVSFDQFIATFKQSHKGGVQFEDS